MKVINTTRNTILACNCSIAHSFWARFKGLQLKRSLPQGSGLLITPCNSIHMFFMRFPIDAVFIDKDQVVLFIEENIKPWRISKMVRKSKEVLELPAGTSAAAGAKPGDRLQYI